MVREPGRPALVARSGLVVPPAIRPGARIAAVSLSWGGPSVLPARYEQGVRQLESAFEVEVVELPSTRADAALLDRDPALRVADLHAAFADDSIDAVVSTIGGEDSIRLLPMVDLDLLAANPKAFVGYSDSTITHLALRRAGVVSYYGPALMAGFGESGGLHDYLVRGVRSVLVDGASGQPWPENTDGWTVEFQDWADEELLGTARPLRQAAGWRWHGGAPAVGPVVVGCLEVLDWLRGSDWWPPLDGAVLALETSEEAPPPTLVQRFLRTLALTGELATLAGIVFGRPGGDELTDEERLAYDDAILRVVRTEQGLDELAVVTGVDFGHTDPMWTVPMGVTLAIDPVARTLTFTEQTIDAR